MNVLKKLTLHSPGQPEQNHKNINEYRGNRSEDKIQEIQKDVLKKLPLQ
jgi:hypothetical protein